MRNEARYAILTARAWLANARGIVFGLQKRMVAVKPNASKTAITHFGTPASARPRVERMSLRYPAAIISEKKAMKRRGRTAKLSGFLSLPSAITHLLAALELS